MGAAEARSIVPEESARKLAWEDQGRLSSSSVVERRRTTWRGNAPVKRMRTSWSAKAGLAEISSRILAGTGGAVSIGVLKTAKGIYSTEVRNGGLAGKWMSLFRRLGRIPNMIGGATTAGGTCGTWNTWEGRVAAESEVARLKRGDLDALSELITRYQNRLYRFLLRIVREPAEAEDLFQQTWVRVAEKIRQFDASRNFEAWLFTLARNLAIDQLRRIRPESLDEQVPGDARGETAADKLASRERPVM